MSQEPTFSPSHGVRPSFCVIFICPFTWLCVMFGFWQLLFCTVCYGLPWRLSGEEFACQCRRCRFHPWVRKILWRRKWQLRRKQYSCLGNPRQRNLAGYIPWGHKRVGNESFLYKKMTFLYNKNIIHLKIADSVDLQYSHHKKWSLCCRMAVLAEDMVVIIL